MMTRFIHFAQLHLPIAVLSPSHVKSRLRFLGFSACWLGSVLTGQALAIPGQTVDEAAAWMQANQTLQPGIGETLLVRKSDTPARRFTFEALTTSPGLATLENTRGVIRTEQITLFDRINGVSKNRLENSLGGIYGVDILQDYQQAAVVYQYPTPALEDAAVNQDAPLLDFMQGEVRQGDRFGYWVETVQTRNGTAYSGQISVFLLDDLDKLVQELQTR